MRTSSSIKQYIRDAWPVVLVLNISVIICTFIGLKFYTPPVRPTIVILLVSCFTVFVNYSAFVLFLTERVLPKEQELGKIIKRFRRGDNRMQNYVFPLDFVDENYEIRGRCLTYNPIGGDFYNFLKDRTGNYWMGIGDTSGHGYVAGLFSMMVMNQMTHLVHQNEYPHEIIDQIIEHLEERTGIYPHIHRSLYATFLLMRADSEGNFLHSGIHPSLVLYKKKEDRIEIVGTDGKFLSTVMNPPLKRTKHSLSFKMDPDDILFCFTDGLFEQKNRNIGEYYGENLYKFLESVPKKNIERLMDDLFTDVVKHTGGRIQDDMSLLVVRKL
ncbi:serine/threonine-protein phosphatase [Leptospira wolffii]|uniref:Phosphatase n=1 Tax=Leptospira wolffii TaxID=409998 RepID=A0A2M9Z772_9LEPT|nr:PP2C family protein-serine/threonine phosphatase [Leptospira wolffii]PJZ64172.1 phosphatase [Leptospira wolffii]TGK56839.1 serine/threonine-protein phosphatase [Leptospira wolffii]TGK71579.1 serine/threonine-protein phosphatase [Leptospira wolffii]TGK75564.1 serine/threonine-protein phosphatase [Leptospira wolffii]TGL32946.1 serine/threonine-protein phosphatase [Leptospira wolffii]